MIASRAAQYIQIIVIVYFAVVCNNRMIVKLKSYVKCWVERNVNVSDCVCKCGI